jgi:hypothetical protein
MAGTVRAVAQAGWAEKVLDCFEAGDILLEKEIKARIGSSPAISKAIRILVDDQKLIRSGKGGKSDPYHYRLAEGDVLSDDASLLAMLAD